MGVSNRDKNTVPSLRTAIPLRPIRAAQTFEVTVDAQTVPIYTYPHARDLRICGESKGGDEERQPTLGCFFCEDHCQDRAPTKRDSDMQMETE